MKKILLVALCLISVSVFAQPAGYKSGSWMSDWWANTGYGATDAPSFMVVSGVSNEVVSIALSNINPATVNAAVPGLLTNGQQNVEFNGLITTNGGLVLSGIGATIVGIGIENGGMSIDPGGDFLFGSPGLSYYLTYDHLTGGLDLGGGSVVNGAFNGNAVGLTNFNAQAMRDSGVITNGQSNVVLNGLTNQGAFYTSAGKLNIDNAGQVYVTTGPNIGNQLRSGAGTYFRPNGSVLAHSTGFMQDNNSNEWMHVDGSVDFTFGTSNVFLGSFSGNGSGLTNLPAAQLTGTIPQSLIPSNAVNQSIFAQPVDVVFIGDSLTDKTGLWGGTNWVYYLSNKLSVAYSGTFNFITNSGLSGNRVDGAGGILARYSSEITPLWNATNGHLRLVCGDGFVNDIGSVTYANMQTDFSNLVFRVHADGAYLLWWDVPVTTNYTAAQEIDRMNMNDFLAGYHGVDYLYQVSKIPALCSTFRYDNVHQNTNGYYFHANAIFGLLSQPPLSQATRLSQDASFRRVTFIGTNSVVTVTNGTLNINENSSSGRNPTVWVAQDGITGLKLYEQNGVGDIMFDSTYNPSSGSNLTNSGFTFRSGTWSGTLRTNMVMQWNGETSIKHDLLLEGTINRATNSGPTGLTWGVTPPDAWVSETNSGVQMWSPRWINH